MTEAPHAIAVAVIAYESEQYLRRLLDRIPVEVLGQAPLLLISDDASSDATCDVARAWAEAHPEREVHVRRNERNLGYGGNQKACFEWAASHGAEVVALLHGDDQYPPELLGELLAPIVERGADASFGSRMSTVGGARRGGMPLVRIVGNRSLTLALNLLTGARLSEWVSGFRAYRISALHDVGLDALPDGFDVDIAAEVAFVLHGLRIDEVAIPTHYGEQISRVPLVRTGIAALRHGSRALVARRRGAVARTATA